MQKFDTLKSIFCDVFQMWLKNCKLSRNGKDHIRCFEKRLVFCLLTIPIAFEKYHTKYFFQCIYKLLHNFPLPQLMATNWEKFSQRFSCLFCRIGKKILYKWSKISSSSIYWLWVWNFFNTVVTIWCPYLATPHIKSNKMSLGQTSTLSIV